MIATSRRDTGCVEAVESSVAASQPAPAPDMAKKTSDHDEPLLTLSELATYLHLDENTVLKLASAGKIPGIPIEKNWRFKRKVVDEWLEHQLAGDDEAIADVPDGMKVPLEELLPNSALIPTLKSRDPLAVIEELAARAYSNNWLADKPWFVGAVVERESLASTAMEGGVAFLHTRAKDKGKIARPFMICGRYLFFLLGLKYDRLHLPILGRLARALRNPATIAKLRSLSSPDQMRAVLLKEDAQARAGIAPPAVTAESFQPKLDRTLRLRAIRRASQAQLKEPEEPAAPAKGGKKAKVESPAAKLKAAVVKAAAAPAKPAETKVERASDKPKPVVTRRPRST
jgi:excisionase family DNA binding protein